MKRVVAILFLAAVAAASVWWAVRSGNASVLALAAVAAIGVAVYRHRAARAVPEDRFFGDAGEDTRLTNLPSPSEMPVDRDRPR